ncbi:uncharacterized protein CELE_F40D4.17 [Caenorhabditis elegans]|uniref:Uncharacterized protein n=1 Tax=Caenorhabditis elegans TaxID=6239 RepID=C6KRN5_CAEEL|nr:Uncharacterized protein CELE_F40D4.17 [Caenorhabditis elegans]CAZ65499.1 Uncharacterized protein CELE_F40D4.17 [Caenorhabditis elegans]|eukprot:NP_001256733.1 Uncharacterized protein CELE_F40D4.17 [Caenorhabditis elegans]
MNDEKRENPRILVTKFSIKGKKKDEKDRCWLKGYLVNRSMEIGEPEKFQSTKENNFEIV